MTRTGFRKTLYKHRKYIGVIGALISLVSFWGFLKTVWRTKETVNFPYGALYLTIAGWALTILYGVIDHSEPTTVLGITYLCIFSFILYIKITSPQATSDDNHHPSST